MLPIIGTLFFVHETYEYWKYFCTLPSSSSYVGYAMIRIIKLWLTRKPIESELKYYVYTAPRVSQQFFWILAFFFRLLNFVCIQELYYNSRLQCKKKTQTRMLNIDSENDVKRCNYCSQAGLQCYYYCWIIKYVCVQRTEQVFLFADGMKIHISYVFN